jgi:hypothetical protein
VGISVNSEGPLSGVGGLSGSDSTGFPFSLAFETDFSVSESAAARDARRRQMWITLIE